MTTTHLETQRGGNRWAYEEFGHAALGNRSRTKRLVEMAGAAARSPGGLLTEVFPDSGDREGAYKFVENEQVPISAISASACRASAIRANGMPYVFVPVDGSSLSFREYSGQAERRVGSVGAYQRKGSGILVMNSIVVDPTGVPLGLFDQQWWTRPKAKQKKESKYKRKLLDKETKHWLAGIETGRHEWKKANPETRLWFQLDRGGDFKEMLAWADARHDWITIRAAHDRKVLDSEEQYLWAAVESAPLAGCTSVELPKTKTRAARTAKLELRYAPVTIRLRNRWTKVDRQATLWAVLAAEQGAPAGTEPVEWLLLTNREVRRLEDAKLVLYGYTQRWRVEQFHKTWKSVCRVEQSQLRDLTNLERWATILASVSMRLLRLTYLARVHPGLPATVELSKLEVAALIVEKGKGKLKLGDMITIETATRWLAEMGGYVGPKASGGPPGTTVLTRGLRRVTAAAQAIGQVLEFVQ